jgi:hypothetical protein
MTGSRRRLDDGPNGRRRGAIQLRVGGWLLDATKLGQTGINSFREGLHRGEIDGHRGLSCFAKHA